MTKKLISPTTSERLQEKQKDYRNVVIIQVIIIVFGLTFSDFLIGDPSTPGAKLITTILSFFAAVYSFLLWDLLRNFTSSKILINTILIILSGVVIVGSMSEFPYYKILEVPNRQLFLLLIHSLIFIIEITVIGFATRDIFSGEFLTSDKLWGAAWVFLMTGITFGNLFHLICLIKPGSLGEAMDIGLANYSETATYSMCILGGMDPGHPGASRIIRNIGVIEAVWSNLFVVLIIGKLMSLPRPPKAGDKKDA